MEKLGLHALGTITVAVGVKLVTTWVALVGE